MGDRPLYVGAVHVTRTDEFLLIATTWVGLSGAVGGVAVWPSVPELVRYEPTCTHAVAVKH